MVNVLGMKLQFLQLQWQLLQWYVHSFSCGIQESCNSSTCQEEDNVLLETYYFGDIMMIYQWCAYILLHQEIRLYGLGKM